MRRRKCIGRESCERWTAQEATNLLKDERVVSKPTGEVLSIKYLECSTQPLVMPYL